MERRRRGRLGAGLGLPGARRSGWRHRLPTAKPSALGGAGKASVCRVGRRGGGEKPWAASLAHRFACLGRLNGALPCLALLLWPPVPHTSGAPPFTEDCAHAPVQMNKKASGR